MLRDAACQFHSGCEKTLTYEPSLPYLSKAIRILQPYFRAKIAIISFLMLYCVVLVGFCSAELKCDRILAVGGRGSELQLLGSNAVLHSDSQSSENQISCICGPL